MEGRGKFERPKVTELRIPENFKVEQEITVRQSTVIKNYSWITEQKWDHKESQIRSGETIVDEDLREKVWGECGNPSARQD